MTKFEAGKKYTLIEGAGIIRECIFADGLEALLRIDQLCAGSSIIEPQRVAHLWREVKKPREWVLEAGHGDIAYAGPAMFAGESIRVREVLE